jgi:PKHD-type hydroxylase
MAYKNFYWCFEKVLSNEFCDKVIKFGKAQNISKGKISAEIEAERKQNKISKKQDKEYKKIRNSNVSFLSHQWLYDEIWPYIIAANTNAEWNFEFDWAEPAQFTVYDKKQHYTWHTDAFTSPYNEEFPANYFGKIRKLSMVCSLSDPVDYKGGDLELDFRNREDGKPQINNCTYIKQRGSIVVFPSTIWHRVKPITSGTRYSLVLWFLGKPFK